MMDVISTMKSLEILKSLKPNELLNLSKSVEIVDFRKKQFVFKSGMVVKYVFVILEGSVKLGVDSYRSNSIVKEILTEGDIFGENVFVDMKVRSDYAMAMSDVKILKIPVNEFRVLVISNPQFYQVIMGVIIERLHILEERMKSFVFTKARSRIMNFLKVMGDRRGRLIGMKEILLRLNLSHNEIGLLTDTSRQTVARVLGDLKRENIIHFTTRKPGRILIRDMQLLC